MNLFLYLSPLALATLTSAIPFLTAHVERSLEARDIVKKRGLAYNDENLTKLFLAPNSKVSWMYNWDSTVHKTAPVTGYEFVPMLWSNETEHTNPWNQNVDLYVKQKNTTHVLAFNEPDQCGGGGSCMQNVSYVISGYRQWIQPLATKYVNLKLGSPAVTNGGDPMGLAFLKSFLDGCTGCKVDFCVIHWYDAAWNVGYFKNHIQDAHTVCGSRPIWITEFGPSGSDADQITFLNQVLPWLDNQTYVERYSMTWTGPNSLVNSTGTGLSAVGQAYNTI